MYLGKVCLIHGLRPGPVTALVTRVINATLVHVTAFPDGESPIPLLDNLPVLHSPDERPRDNGPFRYVTIA